MLALAVLVCLAGMFAASATRAEAASPAASAPAAGGDGIAVEDPFERWNRRGFAIHQAIDHAILRPLARGYQHHAPGPLQTMLHNLVTTLSEPVVFGNDVLQLRFARAGQTLGRFMANATFGIGGLFDVATKAGVPHHDNGFGTTLGRYGIAPGPYLFIPLLGPSNFRDLIGTGVDFFSDPVSRLHYHDRGDVTAGVWIISGVDARAQAESELEQIEMMGTDSYATMRSLYMQNRQSEIRGGTPVNIQDLPNLEDPAAAPASPGPAAASSPPAGAPAPAATDASAVKPSSAVVPAARAETGAAAPNVLTPPAPEWLATWPPSRF